MFKVLLVDDEPLTFIGLKKIFNWQTWGFEIIGETTNPYEAIDLIKSLHPDVVFIDIRMPELSGIDIMRKIREENIDTEFVVVSGYAEFSYAQQAIKYGAFDYCLKPINIDQEDNLLQRLFEHLISKKLKRNLELFENCMDKRLTLKNFLSLINIPYEGQYFRGVFWISTEKSMDIYQFLRQKEVLFFVKLTPQKYFFIICCEEIPIDYLRYLHDGIIGTSIPHTQDSLISNVFSQAHEAAYNTFIYQNNGVFEYRNPCYSIVNQLINDISSAIEKKDSENLKNIFLNLSGFFKSNRLTIGDVTYFWNQLSLYLNKLDPSEYSDMNIIEYDEIVNVFCNIENMSEYLLERIEGVISKNKQFEYCSNENFLKLIEYIDNHYSEPLSLKELSAKFFISLNYCCELFRKVIGCSFTEYLTNLRMKKAEELLKTTNYSVAEIARLVGYNDYYHFNKAFKKFYGTPPATFRKKHSKINGKW